MPLCVLALPGDVFVVFAFGASSCACCYSKTLWLVLVQNMFRILGGGCTNFLIALILGKLVSRR